MEAQDYITDLWKAAPIATLVLLFMYMMFRLVTNFIKDVMKILKNKD